MIKLAYIVKTVTSVVAGTPQSETATQIHPITTDLKTFLLGYLQDYDISSDSVVNLFTEGQTVLVGPINDYEKGATTFVHLVVFSDDELPYYSKFLNRTEVLKTREKLVQLGFEFKDTYA